MSFRDNEDLMANHGIIFTYDAIRQWTLKFGQGYSDELGRLQPQRGQNGISTTWCDLSSDENYFHNAILAAFGNAG